MHMGCSPDCSVASSSRNGHSSEQHHAKAPRPAGRRQRFRPERTRRDARPIAMVLSSLDVSLPHPRAVVERMAGYTPGEQPKPGERVIKLNTNENPFPPSPRVVEAIRRITPDALRRYPSSMADEFRAVAARVHGVSADSVLAGNGSEDILQIALRSYCGPGDVLVCLEPTYSLYPVLADLADVRLIPVPWDAGWGLPANALVRHAARAIFFANPNSPSGTSVPVADVEALAEATEAL